MRPQRVRREPLALRTEFYGQPWTLGEKLYIRKHADKTAKEIGKALGRLPSEVTEMIEEMGRKGEL